MAGDRTGLRPYPHDLLVRIDVKRLQVGWDKCLVEQLPKRLPRHLAGYASDDSPADATAPDRVHVAIKSLIR
jgi:hypothetical protein